MAQIIEYKNVDIYQKEQIVLKDVSLTVQTGQFYYLIGKVGSGKSSLLKTMYAELPVKGDATVLDYYLPKIKNKEIPFLRRKIGIIFQDFQLLTDRSIFDNLQFVLKATGWKNKEEMKKRISEVLKEVGMGAKGYKMPHELSGGEQQRIVIARALLNKPKLILADEPTGNLDPETGNGLVDLLHNICKNEDTTIIMATHNHNLLETHPGNVWTVENHCLTSQSAQTSINSTANCSNTVEAE